MATGTQQTAKTRTATKLSSAIARAFRLEITRSRRTCRSLVQVRTATRAGQMGHRGLSWLRSSRRTPFHRHQHHQPLWQAANTNLAMGPKIARILEM